MFFGGGGGGFPFGGFEDDDDMRGGFPGGGRRGGPPKKEVDTQKLYDLLGVDKEADFNTIKKAYRKLAIKHHPDKGGDMVKFQEIQNAYDIIGDKDKRELYDKYGEEGAKNGGPTGGGGMDDIFSMFMGGQGRGGPSKKQMRVKPITKQVEVTLADIYNGKEIFVECERQRICPACDGVGGSDASAVQTCKGCKGRGMKVTMRQMGPGMYSQSQGPCDDCHGTGEIINIEKRCKECKGKKVKKDRKKLKVEMDKGTPQAEQYVIHGEGDCVPEVEPGDVIVVIKIRPNKTFQRKGADLLIEKEITLLEALTGIDFTITHLDGRDVRIQNSPGDIIKPDSMMTCEDLGMPFHKSPYKFGNLFIKFTVRFPEKMNQAQIDSANVILAGQKKSGTEQKQFDSATEKVTLVKFQESHKNTHAQGGTHAHNSDEEGEDDDGEGVKVGCNQQ